MGTTTSGVGLESLEYRRETGTYRAEYDRDAMDPSLAVVAALTDVLEVSPIDIEPLYEAVDTDALDALVESGTNADAAVSFEVADHAITVRGDGTVTVDPPRGDRSGDEAGPDDAPGTALGR